MTIWILANISENKEKVIVLLFFHRWQCKTCINLGGHVYGHDIFISINGLRGFIPVFQLAKITELLWLYRIIKEKHNIKGDFYRTVSITRTFDTYNVTRVGGLGRGSSHRVLHCSPQWALWSMKTSPKISSYRPEIPGFDPRIFGTESKCASNELSSASVLRTVKV